MTDKYPHDPDPNDSSVPDYHPDEIEAAIEDPAVADSLVAVAVCALELGESPSQGDYVDWRRSKPGGERAKYPSTGYISNRCGKWNDAKERLGLSTVDSGPSLYQHIDAGDVDVDWDHEPDDFEDRYDLDRDDEDDGDPLNSVIIG